MTITDRTAGNDYWQQGDNLHRVVNLECAVPETTTVAPTTVPDFAFTTTSASPEPTVTVALEPTTTEVVLAAPVPSFVFPEELYSAEPTTTVPYGPCVRDR